MSNSRSPAAYPEQRMYLENAMSTPDGLVLTFPTLLQAANWCGRCHSFRALMREKYYDRDDRLFGTTPWDVLRIVQKDCKVYILHRPIQVLEARNFRTGELAHIIDIDAIDRELTEKKRSKAKPVSLVDDKPPLTLDDLDWKPLDN